MPHPTDPTTTSGHRWALAEIHPPTRRRLAIADRAGIDPNRLLGRLVDDYRAAVSHDADTIDALAGDDDARRDALWDECNAIALERHGELWVTPLLHAAQILNPGATHADLRATAGSVGGPRGVGHGVRRVRQRQAQPRTCRVVKAATATPRPRARRTAASSSTSSADPGGDDPPGEPPPPQLALAPPPRATLSYALLTAEQRGADVERVTS